MFFPSLLINYVSFRQIGENFILLFCSLTFITTLSVYVYNYEFKKVFAKHFSLR